MIRQIRSFFFNAINSGARREGIGLKASVINRYNASRERLNTRYICHAPFSNMYFNVHGDCAPCWLTFIDPDSYPNKSVREIWFGEKYQTLRNNLLAYNLTDKCNVCLKNLNSGNYVSVLARAYDVNEPADYPSMLELELDNTCNLECVMCIGELSSSIRRNREKLPALHSPYDDAFVEQLEEFIPHLKELRFNGGEPFLIKIVYQIFEKVEKLNPGLKIVLATNGTILNNKVKQWLNKLNIHINFSLDSLTPAIYESIRVNAKFERVMEHFQYYREYCREKKRTLCIMVNPMRNNWHEMPEFIRFVNKHNVNIWFNTIHRPLEWSIWALPENELKQIYDTLSSATFSKEDRAAPLAAYNISIYKNLVQVQIKNWVQDAREREMRNEKPEGAALSNEDAKALLEKKIADYVYAKFNEGEEQKKYRLKLLMEKISAANTLLEERNGKIGFYLSLYQAPAELVYREFESRSINSLVEDYENRALQKA